MQGNIKTETPENPIHKHTHIRSLVLVKENGRQNQFRVTATKF